MISIESRQLGGISSKNICYLYLKNLETSSAFSSDLSVLRKKFYENSKRKQVIKSIDNSQGFPVVIKAAIANKNLSFKKTINKVITEEAFKTTSGFVLQRRDTNAMLCCKIYYNNDMTWYKTEYFSSNNYIVASHVIKPSLEGDSIEFFAVNDSDNTCVSKKLFPISLDLEGTQKRLIDSSFNEDAVYVLFDNAMSIYCEKEFFETINNIISGKKENKKEEIIEETSEENDLEDINFEECEKPQEEIIEIMEEKPQIKYEDVQYMEIDGEYNFTGRMLGGKKQGIGRLEKLNGMTIFDGQYVDDKKDGQGSLHNNDGKLLYTGNWKDDKEHGVGVAYTENDLSVSNWNEGKIGEFVTTIDKFGDISHAGKIINGKKQGAGVKFINENSVLVVEKFIDDKSSNATIFDDNGNMVYTGGFSNGMKNGYGIEFDENLEIIFKGTFKDDNYASGTLVKKIEIE